MNEQKRKNHLFRLLSFLVPLVLLVISFIAADLEPFGSLSPMLGDGDAEYYPHILTMKRIIENHESLYYTWRSMMGTGVGQLISLTSSPFYIPLLFLPESAVHLYLSVTIILRLAFAGLGFTLLLQTVRPQLDLTAVCFSSAYAVCSWIVMYLFELVWLDTFALAPLLLAGVIKLVRDHDMRLFPLVLAYSTIINYYFTYMTCGMVFLFWVGLLIYYRIKGRALAREIFRFAFFSLLGVAMAGVVIVPSLIVMQDNTMVGDPIRSWTEFYGSIGELIGQLPTFTISVLNSHPAVIGSSILLVFLFAGYLTAGRIPLRERIYAGFVVVFLIFSLWYAPMNYVWHGFNYPNVTEDRFAYLIPMTLAFCGWRFTVTMDDELMPDTQKWKRVLRRLGQFILMGGVTAGVLFCSMHYKNTDIVLVPAAAAGFYLILYMIRTFAPKRASIFRFVLLVLFSAEITVSSIFSLQHLRHFEYANELPQKNIQDALNTVRADAEQKNMLFYRTLLVGDTEAKSNRDLRYDMRGGISSFHSALPEGTTLLCEHLGFATTPGGNNLTSQEVSPFAMMLVDTHYYVAKESRLSLKPIKDMSEQVDAYYAYAASCEPDFGYCIADAPADYAESTANEMEVQNHLFRAMTGLSDDLYTCFAPDSVIGKDMKISDRDDGMQHIIADDFEGNLAEMEDEDLEKTPHPEMTFSFEIPADGCYYLGWRKSDHQRMTLRSAKVIIDGENFTELFYKKYNGPLFDARNMETIGYLKKGQKVDVRFQIYAGDELNMQVSMAKFDEELFEEGCEILKAGNFRLTEFHNDQFKASAEPEKDCILYLSVPYDKGWTATVDGQPAETERIFDAMTGIRLTAGKHEIAMQFRPRAQTLGWFVSAGALGVYLLIVLVLAIIHLIQKLKAKKAAKAAAMKQAEKLPELDAVTQEQPADNEPDDVEPYDNEPDDNEPDDIASYDNEPYDNGPDEHEEA